MTTSIEAVYEGGVFRPTRQVTLTEGTHVEVIIPAIAPLRDSKAIAAKLAQVAARAPRSEHPDSASVDHDQVLYARRNQP